jgi:hypothetical protein
MSYNVLKVVGHELTNPSFSSLMNRRVRVMVFNATFNNISVISWRAVLLVEETGVPRENHGSVINH